MNRIEIAHAFARAVHGDQERKFTGVPYLTHLEETAQLLWEATDGQASNDEYVAALLHDTIEDTDVTREEISREFGEKPAKLVEEVSIDEREKEKLGKKDYLVKAINVMTEEAFTIKLCDRLSNVVGLEDKRIPNKFVKWYIKETDYILSNIDRPVTKVQEVLIKKINSMLLYLKLNRSL